MGGSTCNNRACQLEKKLQCRTQLPSQVANDMLGHALGKSADWVKMPLHCGIHRRRNDEVLALVPKVPRASEAGEEVVADSAGELGEGVCREGCDEQEMCPPP
jgi:hypothetical protein